MADRLTRGIYRSDNGYPSNSSFWRTAILGSDGDSSNAYAVNANAVAVGRIKELGETYYHAVKWNPKSNSYTTLVDLAGMSQAKDINNNAIPTIVGFATFNRNY